MLLFTLSACDYGARRQISVIKDENESLQAQLELSSVYIEDVTEIMDEVQQNLLAIEEREGIIGRISLESQSSESTSRRRSVNVRRELLTSISDIDTFIKENREKMDVLKARIASSSVRIESLERLVTNLTASVEEKERNVVQLKDQVRVLEANIASLQGQLRERDVVIQTKDSTIAEQVAAINELDAEIQTRVVEAATAYYVVDTRQTLRTKGLIRERRGGFLGLKKTTSVGAIMIEHFRGIPKNQSRITLDPSVKNVEIISAHRDRPDLYRFDRSSGSANLVLNDPEGFWSLSDYLVIVSDD